jgi:hemerythrin
MGLFQWYKAYSVNNEELDKHHKAIIDILNRLYDNCISNSTRNCLEPIVDELVSYADYHFAAEEQHMRNIGYKDIEKHISEHKSFTTKVLQLQQLLNNDDYEFTKELIVFLGGWILEHVMKEDKKFSV